MASGFRFVADRVIKGRIYPALARHQARPYTQAWREFGQHWPYTTPLRLQEYCQQQEFPLDILNISDDLPADAFYPVCLGFFDFDIDYFDLLPDLVRQRISRKELRILFYYHEGDNPSQIQCRLDDLCGCHGLDLDCYRFISANTSADRLDRFLCFHDFELWYYQRNIDHAPLAAHQRPRTHEFTVLSRTHKWWRATVMADLDRMGVLERSIWSYCQAPDDQSMTDNPIQVDLIPQLRFALGKFCRAAPYQCDDLVDADRNNHAVLMQTFFTDSYCNIVLESQFDVDQSGGAFLTEKTFKPIKHGQLFFIVGAAGSLAALRSLGYRVFDNHLDTGYDLVQDPTHRWMHLRDSIKTAQQVGLDVLYQRCRSDIEHNQTLFMCQQQTRLNTLLSKLNESCG